VGSFAFKRNLEPFEAELRSGDWTIAGHLDLISERRYLLFRIKSDSVGQLAPDTISFRCETAGVLAPDGCAEITEILHERTRLELLTDHHRIIDPLKIDEPTVREMFGTLIRTMAIFERNKFCAPGVSLTSIGQSEDGRFLLLPNAFVLPPPQEPIGNARHIETRHVECLSEIAQELIAGDSPILALSSFSDRLSKLTQGVASGSISSLVKMYRALFDEPLFDDDAGHPDAPGSDPRSHDPEIPLELRFVEIVSDLPDRRRDLLTRTFWRRSEAGADAVVKDGWTAGRRRKTGTKEGLSPGGTWFVDDIGDQFLLRADLLDHVARFDEDPDRRLVYTVDRAPNDDVKSFLQLLKNRSSADCASVTIEGGENDLVQRLDAIARALTGKTASSTDVSVLASTILDALNPEERQMLEMATVAGIAVPFDILRAVFSHLNGDLQKRLHRLAGIGLLHVGYRALPPSNMISVTIAVPHSVLRSALYGRIPEPRLRNLHRTMARLAEERGGFPPLFVYQHLVRAGESAEAARFGVAFLRESSITQREAHLDMLLDELGKTETLEALSYADRLFARVRLAKELFDRGRHGDAERLLIDAREMASNVEQAQRNAALLCEGFRLLSDTLAGRGRYSEALDILQNAKDVYSPHLALAEQALLLNEIGWLHYRLGDYDRSVDSCKLSLNTLNPNEHPIVVAQALNLMGVIHFNTSRYDEAISYYEQSAFLREREQDQAGVAASHNNLALAYQAKGEYDKAFSSYHRSLEIKKRTNNQPGIAAGNLNLALLYLEVHNFDEAEKKCRDSLRISTELGMAQLTADNHSTLGDIAYTRGEFDRAATLYRKSLVLSRSLEASNGEMGAQRRLAKLYLTQGALVDARSAIEEAARIGSQIGSKFENGQIASILGDLCSEEKKFSQAIDHYEKAASCYAAVLKYRLAAASLANVGLAHANGGDNLEAKHCLDRALDLIKSEIGHEIPDEIVTLQQTLRERPLTAEFTGMNSKKLLYAFYELSSLVDYADDKTAFFKRIITVFVDLTDANACTVALPEDTNRFTLIHDDGEQKPLTDPATTTLCTRSLQMGTVLQGTSEEVADIRADIQSPPGCCFVCVPLKAMGLNLGCVLLYFPKNALPLSKEDVSFVGSVGRHVSGALRLAFHLEEHVHKEETLEQEFESLRAQVSNRYRFKNLIGKDESMVKVFRTLEKVKDVDTGILIIGESGTGKTELARTIHYNGLRRKRHFQQIHCAEIPTNLLESELFGHEKGAFTGAVGRKLGRCEVADGGTIFLDDVNVMPMETQSKLLHYLESKSFTRLGGTQKITTDVRIIAASNEDLELLVKEGRFREDLYYRLKVIQIELPPLRERREDMIAIAQEFLKTRCQAQGKPLKTLSAETMRLFQRHPWPGNVRELQNVLEQIVLLSDEDIVEPSSLPEDFLKRAAGGGRIRRQSLEALVQQIVRSEDYSEANPLMPQLEAMLASKMAEHIDSKGRAASMLGITKPTLYNRLKNYEKLR